jgi:predicted  nucleic acid-binding Zn-ribbon protein
MEAQSTVAMLREKLDQVEQAKANLGLDMRTILERKDHTLQEIRQVKAERDELSEVLAGPPRRDPSEDEKHQFHALVTRRAAYMKQLGDLDSRIANIQKRTALVHRSEASFLPMLREAEEQLAGIQTQVEAIEKERHELPVVVGKAIFQPEGVPPRFDDGKAEMPTRMTQPFVDPRKLLNQVTMESKFEILKSAVAPVHEHYKKAKTQAIEAWKVNEFRSLAEQELDSAKARLVRIRDRFVDLQTSSLRSDIVRAIQKYHVSAEIC